MVQRGVRQPLHGLQPGAHRGQRRPGGPRVDSRHHRRRSGRDLLHERRHRIRQLGHHRDGGRPAEEGPPPRHLHHRAPRRARDHGVPGEARAAKSPECRSTAAAWWIPRTSARPSGPTPSWSPSCTATTRWGPSSPSRRSARSPARPACSFTATWSRPPARCRSTSSELNVDMLSMSAHKFYGPKGRRPHVHAQARPHQPAVPRRRAGARTAGPGR